LRFFSMGRPLWRGDGSLTYLYKRYWASPAQPLSCPRTAELQTIWLSHLRLSSLSVAPYDSHGYGGGILTRPYASSYLTGNILLLRDKAQPVNAVWRKSRCLLWEPQMHLLINIQEFIPYLAGNTLRLRYKSKPVNAVADFCNVKTGDSDNNHGALKCYAQGKFCLPLCLKEPDFWKGASRYSLYFFVQFFTRALLPNMKLASIKSTLYCSALSAGGTGLFNRGFCRVTFPSLWVGGEEVAWLVPYISPFIVHVLARQACNPVHIELEGIWDYGAKLVYIKESNFHSPFFFLF
jgi:hypothetical protein